MKTDHLGMFIAWSQAQRLAVDPLFSTIERSIRHRAMVTVPEGPENALALLRLCDDHFTASAGEVDVELYGQAVVNAFNVIARNV